MKIIGKITQAAILGLAGYGLYSCLKEGQRKKWEKQWRDWFVKLRK